MKERKTLMLIWSLSAITAGFIHIFVAWLWHHDILPHLVLFMVWWLFQIFLWIFIWFEKFTKITFWTKIIVHGWFIFMLLFSLFLPVPFIWNVEWSWTIWVFAVFIQFIAIIALLPIYLNNSQLTLLKTIILSLILSLVTWSLAFGLWYIWEHIFPNFKASNSGHHHSEDSY